MLTKIDLCSMALLKLGEAPIQSFSDDTATAQLARTLFEPVTDALIALHPWRFATRHIDLIRNTDGDFLIPSDVLRVLTPDEYSVVENTTFDGGRVVFNDAPILDSRIDIYRIVALSRVVDYQPTAKIDPEHLNADFNFLIEALKDIHAPNVDIEAWRNVHTNTVAFLEYTNDLIQDKLTGGGTLGIFKNLVSVLDNALPKLINDYGYITDDAPINTRDDYGLL